MCGVCVVQHKRGGGAHAWGGGAYAWGEAYTRGAYCQLYCQILKY